MLTPPTDYERGRGGTPLLTPLLPPDPNSSAPSLRHRARLLLSSDAKHYLVMLLVATDVGAALLDILLTLAACDLHRSDPSSHEWSRGLHLISLTFGWAFMAELGVSLWAFGAAFFTDWFHCFDAVVIVGSLVVDLFGEGTVVVEDLGGLVIGLRLWRVGKIVEELSVGVREREEALEEKVRALEREGEALRRRVEVLRGRRGYGGS